MTIDNLRRYIVKGALHGQKGSIACQLSGCSKVCQFIGAVFGDENILRLDITVQIMHSMHFR